MKKLYLLFFLFLCILMRAQTTETFETETGGSTSFTDNGQVFNIISNLGGTFDIFYNGVDYGWNGTGSDYRFIDNSGTTAPNINFSIKTNNSATFTLKSFWIFLSNSALNQSSVNGNTCTIIGKLAGATQFTASASSGFNTTYGSTNVNNGFTFINMSTYGGSNNSNTLIDEFVITTSGITITYLALDAMTWQATPSCALSASINSQTNIACNGGSTGSLTVTASGGTPNYTYAWTNGSTTTNTSSTTNSINFLTAGTYSVTITDGNGCTATASATITQPTSALSATISKTDAYCNGASSGTASVSVSGGTSPYYYSWSPYGGTGANAYGLAAGTYTCTITDANSCQITRTVTVGEPSAVSASAVVNFNITCKGSEDGNATASGTGGTPPYIYSWSDGSTSATAAYLTPGTHTVTVYDSNFCYDTATVTITEAATLLSVSPSSQTNVSCNGGANGTASVTALGGTGGYTYDWTPGNPTGDGSASVTGLTAGTWTCTVTDTNGCSKSTSITITEPSALNLTMASKTNVLCDTGGTASVHEATGGTGNYTYDWTPGNPTGDGTTSISNLSAGTWTCTVTDDLGCSKSVDFTIVNVTGSDIVWGSGSSNTTDDQNGKFANDFSSSGSWEPVYLDGTFTPIQSWRRTTTGTGQGAYWGGLSPIASPSQSDGAAIFDSDYLDNHGLAGNFGGGISPAPNSGRLISPSIDLTGYYNQELYIDFYLYYHENIISELSVGYSNDGGTTWTDVNIKQPGIGSGDVFNTAKVSYPLTGLTGVPNLTDCKLRFTFNGDYYFAMIDDVTVRTGPEELLAVNVASQTNNTCYEGTEGAITVNGTGGTAPYSYSWDNGADTASIANLTAGTYNVTITDANGCDAVASVTITEPASGLFAGAMVTDALCGNDNGTIDVTVTGGTSPYTYLWNTAATTEDLTDLAAGNYNVTITDANGCNATISDIIVSQTGPTVTIAGTDITCTNTYGTAVANVTGGVPPYTYSWSNGANTASITGLTAGTYTVTVTDANLCSNTASVTITEPAPFEIPTAGPSIVYEETFTQNQIYCPGSSNYDNWGVFRASIDAGATYVSITLSGSSLPGGITCNDPVAVTQIAQALRSGTPLSITVDGNTWNVGTNCYTDCAQVADAVELNVDNFSCSCSGNTTIRPCIGNSNWGGLGGSTCGASTQTMRVELVRSVVDIINVSCNGGNNGTITLDTTNMTSGVGPYTYTWSPGNPTGQGTNSISGLSAGSYDLTVTDANGCNDSQTYTVTEPAVLTASISSQTNVACNAGTTGSATVTPSGGTAPYTYLWSNTATTATVTGLAAGTYTVLITDANSCTTNTSVTITEPTAALSASVVGTDVSCNGGSNGTIDLTVTGGTAPYTYAWSNSVTTEDQTGLSAGTYDVTVTDANLCTTTASVTVDEPTVLSASISSQTNIACNGGATGSATVTVTGGTGTYTYSWAPAGGSAATASGLTAGTYTVTVTDGNLCTTNTSVTITEPTTALSASAVATNVSCNGGSNGTIDLTVTGGTAPYTYEWSNSANTEDIINLNAGTYSVTVTDANSCTATASVTITQPTTLYASISSQTNVACNGGTNGSATVTVSGGTGTYTYSWAPTGGTAATASGLAAGTYTVTVTDGNLCNTTKSVTITQPTALFASISSQTNVACNGGATGSATVTVTGGTASYTYLWSNGDTTATATGLTAGTYTVLITDANSCTTNTSVTITQPTTALSASAIATNVSCNGGSNGTIDLTVTGGTAPYAFVWSNTATTEDMTGLTAGTYNVIVTDANSCTTNVSVTVTEPTVLSASSVVTNVSCNGGSNGTIDLTVTGGTAPYTFVWSNTATTEDMTGLTAGTYNVIVTDAKGCTTNASATVNEPTVLSASGVATNVSCNGGSNGTIDLTVTGGTAPYAFVWSNTATTEDMTGLTAATYDVTVTDAKGCTATTSVTITQPTVLSASISSQTNVLCNGAATGSATASATGGSGSYTYLWSNGATTASITGVNAGTYNVTITDANSCTANASVTISQPQSLNLTILTSNVTCNGGSNGSAIATVSGGVAPYSYSWSDSGVVGANPTTLTAGTYTLTVTDDNGCTVNQTITINEPDALTASFSSDNVSCPGSSDGTATVTVTGGTAPYEYLWSNSATTASLVGLTDGTYTVTITDDNGCTLIDSVTVVTTPDVTAPVANVATLPTVTVECNVPAGMITAPTATDNCVGAVTGTTTDPLTYTAQGTYTITWTYSDGNGNSSTQTQTVIVDDITAPVPDVATLSTITVECSVPAGMITAPTATDNCVGAVTGTTTDPLTYTTQGTHTITWTYNDGNGNTSTQTQTVIVDDITAPVANVATLPTVTVECNVPAGMITAPTATDNCAGTVTATTTSPLTYTTQGTHTITWTYNDGNGNTTTQTQTVIVDDITAPVADVTNLPEIVNYCGVMSDEIPVPTATDNCAGVLTATTTDSLDYTEVGTYVITWTYDDGNGNTTTQTQTVTVEESPLNAVTFDDSEFVYNGTVQSINVNNLPAGATVTYTTSPETGSDNGAVNAGVYTVTAVVMPQPEAFNCAPVTLTASITIDRAPQTITFDPLSVKNLEADPDFQLEATASSGLDVYFTYTYTSPDPAADVSSTGWVTLLTSGEITITAHQDGNENYLPAQEVEQPLVIESSDPSIFTMVVGDVTYDTPQSNIYHLIDCGDNSDSVEVTIVTEVGATVQPGHTFTIQTPQPGIYTATVTVTSQDGTSTETYTVTVERRFDFSDIVVQKFDNVLLVNNNPQNNGGYEFTAYEWYRNGQLVGTEQYYSAGNNSGDMLDPDAEYMVKVTTAQGDVLQTCLGQIFLQHVNSARLYPNPVAFGQKLTIDADLPAAELEDMTIAVYTLNGALVKEVKSSSRITEIDAPMEEAVYIVMLKSANYSKTFKVIVR